MFIKTLLLSGITTVALAGLTRDGRQFLPSDIAGDYTRFVTQGTCSQTVNLTSTREIAPGAYSVPHTEIIEDGYTCTGPGALTVISRESIVASGNEPVLTTPPLDKVTAALQEQDATFMIGFERIDRPCGPTGTSAQSIILFVEEERKIEIPGLISLNPGAKYMIVYEPKSPTPCTYFAKFDDRIIGVAVTPSPNPLASEEPMDDEPEYTGEASMDEGVGDSAGKEPSADKEPETMPDATAIPQPEDDEDITQTAAPIPDGDEDKEPVDGVSSPSTPGNTPAGTQPATSQPTTGQPTTDSDSDGGFGFTDEPELGPSIEVEEDDGSTCFPRDATVELKDGSMKRMDEIEIGDMVKVGAGRFSPVFMFTHRTGGISYDFVRISTASGQVLRLTTGHYLYVNGALAAAKSVIEGDRLMTENGVTTVEEVSRVRGVGLYNPQTAEGDIVVDGIVTSTYTTAVESKMAHSMLSPLRALFDVTGISMPWLESGSQLAAVLPSGKIIA